MFEVRIGTLSDGLLLVPEPRVGNPESVVATLDLDGLSATRTVVHHYASGFHDLAEFFSGLEHDWRGWADTRTWESLEGDLRLEARHEHGHVRLTVTLRADRADWTNHGWRVSGDVTIEPGEQLTQIARDVEALVAG